MTPNPLTPQQRHILIYLRTYLGINQQPPPCNHIARDFGYSSPNAASDHMQRLAAKGYLDKNEANNWRLTPLALAETNTNPTERRFVDSRVNAF